MPSPLYVPVAEISQITPHPNAERLEIARVLGWQCVVGRGQFKEGEACIYFPPDTVLSRELSDKWGITQYLDRQRIKATRLRGEPSFGLVMPYSILPPPTEVIFEIGENVADYFGATKWEPPTREAQRGQGKFIPNPFAVPRNPLFSEYTHIANLRHYPDLIGSDELVVVTEKLHGTNSRIGIIDGEWVAGSHRVQRGEADALYWSPKSQPGVEQLVTALAKHHRQVILFGEILGSDVQSLDYGYQGHEGYRAFDLMIDGRFVDWETFSQQCYYHDVPIVPTLFLGYFTFEEIRGYAQGSTVLGSDNDNWINSDRIRCNEPPLPNAQHLREGVVVKPLIERSDPRCGRVILKYVSDDFLLAKHSDFAEV